MAEKDYSGTPLGKKLGAKPGTEVPSCAIDGDWQALRFVFRLVDR